MIDVAPLSWQGGAVIGLLFASIFLSKRIKAIPRDLIFTIAGLLTAMIGIVGSAQIYQAAVNQATMAALGIWLLGQAMRQQQLLVFVTHTALPLLYSAIGFSPVQRVEHIRTYPILWKKIALAILLFAALFSIFIGLPIGTALFCTGIATLAIRAFPIKQTFLEEFPLPVLLEFFSAYLFYFAIANSGLDDCLATLIPSKSLYFALPLFFILAQVISRFTPRAVAFAVLFSVALSLFNGHPRQILAAGIVIALSTALPLFGKRLKTLANLF